MPSVGKRAEQEHGKELKQQLKEQFDLDKDGKLKGDERTAFKEALQARTAREAGVEHTHEKTKGGYQKSTYQRPDKDLIASPHEGHTPRRLQENAMRGECLHPSQYTRAAP
jgi:hypothetical protein